MNLIKMVGLFLVDILFCKILNLDLLDISVKYWVCQLMRVVCLCDMFLIYVFGGKLFVNWIVVNILYLKEGKMVVYCRYQLIQYFENGKYNDYFYFVESDKFREWVNVSKEFICIQCYNVFNNVIYINFYYVMNFFYSKFDVEVFLEIRILNVLLVGVDFVLRMNYIWYMKKIQQVMLKLGVLEFVGYNKVVDNIFVNFVFLLVGKFVEELLWNEKICY